MDTISKIIQMVLTATCFVGCITPVIKKIAEHIGAMDIPN